MNKSNIKKLFKAIENKNNDEVLDLLDLHPGEIDVYGIGGRLFNDKTPLMYSLQCDNLDLAGKLIEKGADVNVKMSGGPKSSVIQLTVTFARGENPNFDKYLEFVNKLLDLGASADEALWPACHAYSKAIDRFEIIEQLINNGANIEKQVGDSGSSVKELMVINSRLFSDRVLELFGLDPNSSA